MAQSLATSATGSDFAVLLHSSREQSRLQLLAPEILASIPALLLWVERRVDDSLRVRAGAPHGDEAKRGIAKMAQQ